MENMARVSPELMTEGETVVQTLEIIALDTQEMEIPQTVDILQARLLDVLPTQG